MERRGSGWMKCRRGEGRDPGSAPAERLRARPSSSLPGGCTKSLLNEKKVVRTRAKRQSGRALPLAVRRSHHVCLTPHCFCLSVLATMKCIQFGLRRFLVGSRSPSGG